MKKKRSIDDSTLYEVAGMVQLTVVTDEDHPASWWMTDFGKSIHLSQSICIEAFKKMIVLCSNKEEIQKTIDNLPIMIWPLPKGDELPFDYYFYQSNFGQAIKDDWARMWGIVSEFLNSLA